VTPELFRYGSYEAQFLKRMEERHGGDPGILARIKSRSVNILSSIHARVYFPVHSNDLKSVAGCLGFRWSIPESSGSQAIVWRYNSETSGDDTVKRRLLVYNREDCSAVEALVSVIQSLADDTPRTGSLPEVAVAGVGEIEGPRPRKYGRASFALPVFATLTKCAYFDYQRDKVLCRTSPAFKAGLCRKRQRCPTYSPNREVECEPRALCPYCGGAVGLERYMRCQKLIIDLKLFRHGLKRCVTRYKAIRQRCRKCWKTFLPEDYLGLPSIVTVHNAGSSDGAGCRSIAA
jgi:hypothetical protein